MLTPMIDSNSRPACDFEPVAVVLGAWYEPLGNDRLAQAAAYLDQQIAQVDAASGDPRLEPATSFRSHRH